MQQNAIFRIFLLALFMLVAMVASIKMFSMEGNVLGNSFRFLTPIAVMIGMGAPRLAIYLLLLSGGYLDFIKRFMILDNRFGDADLATLLGFAPALVAGMVLHFLLAACNKSSSVSARDFKLFVGTTVLCSFLGASQVLMSGELRSLGSAVNMVAYLYMPLLIPRIFKDYASLRKMLIWMTVIYMPATLWALHQAYYGLEAFERQYLLSGMTNEIRQLDEAVFRNMGTMVSAHALSMVASIFATALIIPISWKTGRLSPKVWLNPLRLFAIWLFVTGAYYTFSRTGWVCAVISLLAFWILQSRFFTYAAFFATLVAIASLYLSADYLFKSRITQEQQEVLFNKFAKSAEAQQTMVLGTLDARLESMASFVNDPSIWTPFGMKLAKKEVQINWVHDILTENLIRIGYVPLIILGTVFLVCVLLAFRALFRMPKGPLRTLVTYFAALALGIMSGGFSQGSMILYFPINFFWCMFLAISYTLYLRQQALPDNGYDSSCGGATPSFVGASQILSHARE